MRIDRLDVYHVSMPLIYPWRTAYGEDHAIDSVLVKATSDGVTAWSEATPFRAPHYVPESAGSVYHLVSEIFGPLVVGREFDTAAALDARLARLQRQRLRQGRHRSPLVDPRNASARVFPCTPSWAAPTPT